MVDKLPARETLENDNGRLVSFSEINEIIDSMAVETAARETAARETADVAAKTSLALSSNTTTVTLALTVPTTVGAVAGAKNIDFKLSLTSGTFAAGVSVSSITEDGSSIADAHLDLEGLDEVYLSQLIDPTETASIRPALSTYAGAVKTFVLTWAGTVAATLKIEAIISDDSFATEEEIAIGFRTVSLSPA